MYKIGAFAQICQVSVQTLRYYERLGLLSPEQTDPFTNYRYYTLRQIEQVNRILALKELGLTLEQIRDFVSDNISNEQVEAMLKAKYAEIQQVIAAEQERLNHIAFHIRLLEKENKMSDNDMTIKTIEPMRILSYVATYDSDAAGRDMFRKAIAAVKAAGVPLKHDYIMAINEHEYERHLEDLEIAFPVADDYEGEVRVDGDVIFTVRDLDGVDTALNFMHKGVFEGENGMQESVRLAYMWMAENGYEPMSPVRVNYIALAPQVVPEDQLRQVQIPIKKLED